MRSYTTASTVCAGTKLGSKSSALLSLTMASCRSPCSMYCWPNWVCTRAPSSRCSALVVRGILVATPPASVVVVVTQPDRAAARPALSRTRSSRMARPLVQTLAKFGLATGAIQYLPLELTTCGIDVITARAAQHGQHIGVEQLGLEGADGLDVGALETRARKWIERNKVDLAGRQAAHQ